MSFNVKPEGAQLIITGRGTFDAKDAIKAAGGKWDPENKAWKLAKESATEELLKLFGACCAECTVYGGGHSSCKPHARDGVSFRVKGRYYTGD